MYHTLKSPQGFGNASLKRTSTLVVITQIFVLRHSPHTLSLPNEKQAESRNRETHCAHNHKRILQPHTINPWLDPKCNAKTDDIPDENDGCDDLAREVPVAFEDIGNG